MAGVRDIGDLAAFLFGTCARIFKALHFASWEDVDLQGRSVRIRGTKTVASWLDEAGAPLAEIANQLGHADINVTAKYLGRKTAPTPAADIMVRPEAGHPTYVQCDVPR